MHDLGGAGGMERLLLAQALGLAMARRAAARMSSALGVEVVIVVDVYMMAPLCKGTARNTGSSGRPDPPVPEETRWLTRWSPTST